MAIKYRIVAEGGDRMCRVCESFDGKEFYMVEFEEGVNAPPFHPNCRCTYEVFEDTEIVNKPLYMPFDGTTVLVPPYFQRNENYIEAASTFVSFEQIKQETAKIRNDITASTPYVSVNGEPYSKPVNGIAIINWVRKNGIRVANGKDYSKVTRIGMGFSPYDVDILAEYEKYKRSEANPISYEVFANICSPYWAADLESDIKVNIHKYGEKLIQAITSDSTQQLGSNKKAQHATKLDSNGYGKLAQFFNERRLNISRNYENEPENWEIQLQKSLELYKDKIPKDLTEEERNKLMDEIILFEAKVLQDRYRATYSSTEHIVSKAFNPGLHKKLDPLYTQYKTSEKETNGLLRAAADGFNAGFNAGLTSEVISSVKFKKNKNVNVSENNSARNGLVKDGLGKISGNSYNATQAEINAIKTHLSTNGMTSAENTAMINRIESALKSGQSITGADASFYLHELKEASLMQGGLGYDAAHQAALEFYQVSPYSVYHPEVIQTHSEWFNSKWLDFWGIGK